MEKIKRIGRTILHLLETGRVDGIGQLFKEHWDIKKRMATTMSSPDIDFLHNSAMLNGAIGGKLIGAGGGGFLLFYGDKARLRKHFLGRLREMPFRFEPEGVKVVSDFLVNR